MNQKNIHIGLLLTQLVVLVLNLFIFSSRMPFLPWFVEDSFGFLGIFVTAPLLVFVGAMMVSQMKRKGHGVTKSRQIIPFVASIFSIFIIMVPITDFLNIIALIFSAAMVVITVLFVSQDFSKLSRN